MFAKRIIPCLDCKNGRVVKGIQFVNLRDAGEPSDLLLREPASVAQGLQAARNPLREALRSHGLAFCQWIDIPVN